MKTLLVSLLIASYIISLGQNSKAIYHEVQPKETLYAISQKYHVSIDDIKNWNHLSTNIISIGQKLIVGHEKTTYAASETSKKQSFDISKLYGKWAYYLIKTDKDEEIRPENGLTKNEFRENGDFYNSDVTTNGQLIPAGTFSIDGDMILFSSGVTKKIIELTDAKLVLQGELFPGEKGSPILNIYFEKIKNAISQTTKNSDREHIRVNNVIQTVPLNKVWLIDKVIQQDCLSEVYHSGLYDRFGGRAITIIMKGENYPCYYDENGKLFTLNRSGGEWELVELWLEGGATVQTECEGNIVLVREYNK